MGEDHLGLVEAVAAHILDIAVAVVRHTSDRDHQSQVAGLAGDPGVRNNCYCYCDQVLGAVVDCFQVAAARGLPAAVEEASDLEVVAANL